MKQLFVLGLLFCCLSCALWGQNPRIWSTYYGGPGAEDFAIAYPPSGAATATDASGNVYLLGSTASTSGIATAGAHQTTFGGGTNDCYLVKFDANGNRLWATYYGGSSFEYAYHVATDASGNVYICGETGSSSGVASGGYDNSYNNGGDAFLVKFNSSGVRQWATYYGGPSSEHFYQMAVDGSGNIYNIGFTYSSSGISTAGAYQTTYGGVCDAIVVKFNSSGALQWGTYFGGPGSDNGAAVALDASGNVFISGVATSTTGIASGGFQNTNGGGTEDAFVAKFDASGNRIWATYFGSSGTDNASGMGLGTDPSGNIYLAGLTTSTTGIATVGSHQATFGGGTDDGFIAKISPSCTLLWATYYGGTGTDRCNEPFTDPSGHVYVSGQTSSTNAIASGGFQNTFAGGTQDGFLVRFDGNGNRIISSYYGGPGNEFILSAERDINGKIYCAGMTTSTSAIASGGFQNTFGGGSNDGFLVKFDTQCPTPVAPGTITGNATVCAGSSNTYSIAAVTGATGYTWTLPGGWSGTSTTNSITTTASATSGNITVTADNGCGSSTVQTLAVTVNSIPGTPGAISGNTTVCAGSSNGYAIAAVPGATGYTWTLPGGWSGSSTTNTIAATTGATGGTISVTADNGCGSSTAQTLVVTVNSAPAMPGAITGNATVCAGSSNTYSIAAIGGATGYTWTLPGGWSGSSTTNSITTTAGGSGGTISVTADNGCGVSTAQTLIVTVTTTPAQPSVISGSAAVCQGSTSTFNVVNDPSATSYAWSLPLGWIGSSTTNSIAATAGISGGNITVTASNGCGSSSPSAAFPVSVLLNPVANFSFSGNASLMTFTDLSTNSPSQWSWNFGDGGTSALQNPTHTYATAGNYQVCLTVTNVCSTNTACNNVDVLVGLDAGFAMPQVRVFPNPAHGAFTVQSNVEGNYVLLNALGQVVRSFELTAANGYRVSVDFVSEGVYFIQNLGDPGMGVRKVAVR